MNTILMSDFEKVRLFQAGQLTKFRQKVPGTEYIKEDASVSLHYNNASKEPPVLKYCNSNGIPHSINARYKVGTLIYIREPWARAESKHQWIDDGVIVREKVYKGFQYQSDNAVFIPEADYDLDDSSRPNKIVFERIGPWWPAQQMPRDIARHFAVVTDVRFERLQDMTEEDAIAEGWPDWGVDEDSPLLRYSEEWDNNLKRGEINFAWCCNPWTEVVTFQRATPFDE